MCPTLFTFFKVKAVTKSITCPPGESLKCHTLIGKLNCPGPITANVDVSVAPGLRSKLVRIHGALKVQFRENNNYPALADTYCWWPAALEVCSVVNLLYMSPGTEGVSKPVFLFVKPE